MQIDMNERNRQSFYILEWACSQGVRFKYSVIFNLLTGLRSNFEFLLAFQSQYQESYVVTLYLFQIGFFPLLSIIVPQGFPQVLRTWGGSSKFDVEEGGLKSIHGGSMGGPKMLSKNTCDGVHMVVRLPSISLQACKFIKNELLHTYF